MRLGTRLAVFCLAGGPALVHAAINLDGMQAVDPVSEDDFSPIADINTYHPDQFDCPLPCFEYGNIHSWTPYLSVSRLRRCEEPMLLQFSISQPLGSRDSTILIRSCTLGSNFSSPDTGTLMPVENPKTDSDLFAGGGLELAPACRSTGREANATLDLLSVGSLSGGTGDGRKTAILLDGMRKFFDDEDNCDENFVFAYYQQTVAGVYIGAGLGKSTATSALRSLSNYIQTSRSVGNGTVSQLCGNGRQAERVFGISVENSRDLAGIQKTALEWSKGRCVAAEDFQPRGPLAGVRVSEVATANSTFDTSTNSTLGDSKHPLNSRWAPRWMPRSSWMAKRAVCRYVEVLDGDTCAELATRCGISGADFTKYNSKTGLCSNLRAGDYVCCNAGDPYVRPTPQPGGDGICATHLIGNGDSCDKLAKKYGVTVENIEKWNKGKTWAWTACQDMIVGYNMCVSSGLPPMPPPQQGTECGPLVPGTKPPKDKSKSLADLNPCPLKACCSNWGFCGVFPDHCKVHSPKDGGPGSREKGFQNTCVSNCDNEIKQNSGPPSSFQRIGYYESFGLDRECLLLKAKNANTDGSYTHIHWAFAGIDPNTWKPIINDTNGQWAEFKKLPVKRIVSFGGWAYSTEPATYNIIREAITTNREAFANNLAEFAKDEGIDGIDIDWEYPGAPDILVGGQPIGQKYDGIDYFKFLTLLSSNLIGTGKTVSIAAPASYWYLKAFPIDKIAAVVDYIVYMTYDLHGQWDYGNANAYDMCESGKCIRSHVNLTETMNSLSMITKAGVPNKKIFVGEASYGRSFHMAKNGCWTPMCEFTGSRTQSDAKPGRCTQTGGYLAYAEIIEILSGGNGARVFHDANSNSDILLYQGDYVSYMTPTTKNTRREDWKKLNFAGSIDWAVDLQSFASDDFEHIPDRPKSGEGCIQGEHKDDDSGTLCYFACAYGFCPETVCVCTAQGKLLDLPAEVPGSNARSNDEFNVDLNRLCHFACKYGYCPGDECLTEPESDDSETRDPKEPVTVDDPTYTNPRDAHEENMKKCIVYKDMAFRDDSVSPCKETCQKQLDEAEEEGRIGSYGCVGAFPLDKPVPWVSGPNHALIAPGLCTCDHWLVNELGEVFMDLLPAITQIACYILMSTLKLVLDIGAQFIPGVGKALDVGLDMAITAAKMASYVYSPDQDPAGAFQWWLSPCGGTDLVPDDIKEAFGYLDAAADGVSSWKKPKKVQKGSGKKGDAGNPRSPKGPRSTTTKPTATQTPAPTATRRCRVLPQHETKRVGSKTMRVKSCDTNSETVMTDYVVTTLTYAPNATPVTVTKPCLRDYSQACHHYSSANRNNPQWNTLTCPQAAATKGRPRETPKATSIWSAEHKGSGWQDPIHRAEPDCERDEWPPVYFLEVTDAEFVNGGTDRTGQRMRWIPGKQNGDAGQNWKGVCFYPALKAMTDREIMDAVNNGRQGRPVVLQPRKSRVEVGIDVNVRPEFSFKWEHERKSNPARDDGLFENECWPSQIANNDPGFVLLTLDEWYDNNPRGQNGQAQQWNYRIPYVQGANGN